MQPSGKLFLPNTGNLTVWKIVPGEYRELFVRPTLATLGVQPFGELFLANRGNSLDLHFSQPLGINRVENCSWSIKVAFWTYSSCNVGAQPLGTIFLANTKGLFARPVTVGVQPFAIVPWPHKEPFGQPTPASFWILHVQRSQRWGFNRLEKCSWRIQGALWTSNSRNFGSSTVWKLVPCEQRELFGRPAFSTLGDQSFRKLFLASNGSFLDVPLSQI